MVEERDPALDGSGHAHLVLLHQQFNQVGLDVGVEQAIDQGYSMLVLSDRAIGPDRVPVSALLACGAVHHHLVSRAKRTRIGILIETGEAREVHHHCLLVGYGADGINPYLAFEALAHSRDAGLLDRNIDLVGDYRQAVAKGMLKVMAKMGISTLQSYKGAQIFEAVGLNGDVVETCFAGTASRISGVGFDVLAEEGVALSEADWQRQLRQARAE